MNESQETQPKPEAGLPLAPASCSATMWLLLRPMKSHLFGGETQMLPVAAFYSPEMASEWRQATIHRQTDVMIECKVEYLLPN